MAEHVLTAILILILVPSSLVAGTVLFELVRVIFDKKRRVDLRRETRRAGRLKTLRAILNDHDSPFASRQSLKYRDIPLEEEDKKNRRKIVARRAS